MSLSVPSAPEVVNATALSSTGLFIEWSIPDFLGLNFTSYEILIALYDSPNGGNITRVLTLSSQSNSLAVSGLIPFTLYSISVRVLNTDITGPYSSEILERTFEDSESIVNICISVLSKIYIIKSLFEPKYI